MITVRDSTRPVWFLLLALLGSWPCVAIPTQESGTNNMLSELLVSDDYYSVLDDPPLEAKPGPKNESAQQPCDYDVCLEQKEPCLARKDCLCRGITLEDVAPEAPTVTSLTPGGSEGVTVRWCAPYSLVTTYTIKGAEQEPVRVGSHLRSSKLKGLNDGDKVCVLAENAAGEGPESCMMYLAEKDNAYLTAGLIGGALGLGLLAVLAVLLWKYTQRRRTGARLSIQDRDDSHQGLSDSNRVSLDVL
ncbi:leucine-rich repeat neuronal protein 4 [Gadus chalcogrammus]|uniref:leucine-rich repeat neuronal protein 4 n=1 Tax=Gadus chalcogrammus TaxID=1042646 RepID=UPI0024C23B5F|nr:leucine-rich repeat neuronal protein 4 [Gadus chalcogrammus]